MSHLLLDVQNIHVRFKKYEVGIDSLKELVVRALHRDLKKNSFECLKGINFQINKGGRNK